MRSEPGQYGYIYGIETRVKILNMIKTVFSAASYSQNPSGIDKESHKHCFPHLGEIFKWGFSQTASGKIWTKWGKHSHIENACGILSPMGFFMGQLIAVKTPPKSHGVLCFKVIYLKNYNQYRCTFW
jgi:hypothetical protein